MDDLSRFCCLNPACSDHDKRGHGNLTVPVRYGPRRTRLLRCASSHTRFSERQGSRVVNAAFVERHNGTGRGRRRRKGRQSSGFSKSWRVHVAATRFSDFTYNFCWPVRTLRVKGADGQ